MSLDAPHSTSQNVSGLQHSETAAKEVSRVAVSALDIPLWTSFPAANSLGKQQDSREGTFLTIRMSTLHMPSHLVFQPNRYRIIICIDQGSCSQLAAICRHRFSKEGWYGHSSPPVGAFN